MKEIKYEVIKTLWADRQGPGHHEIRIVRWNDGAPVLEKRQYFTDKATGEVRPGKAKGFTLQDFGFVVEHKDEIKKLMEANHGELE